MEQEIEKQANKTLIIGGVIIAILALGLFTNGFGLFNNNDGKVIDQGGDFIPLSIDNSPVLGSVNAPITMYIFSDFSCPYCAKFSADTFPQIEENYIDAGKVKVVFKYSPTHASGESAHLLGLALNEQDLFWKFHDLAFEHQEDTGNMDKMKVLAQQIGANMTKLDQDLSTHDYRSQLQKDNEMASSNGVSGTPSFIINGKLISGNQAYSQFQKIFDSELK